MKTKTTLLTTIVAIFAMTTVFPSASWSAPTADLCGKLGDLAEVIMKNRQAGVSMQKVVKVLNTIDQFPEATKRGTYKLIDMAYKEPHYQTKKFKQRAIEDFRDNIYRACLEQISGATK